MHWMNMAFNISPTYEIRVANNIMMEKQIGDTYLRSRKTANVHKNVQITNKHRVTEKKSIIANQFFFLSAFSAKQREQRSKSNERYYCCHHVLLRREFTMYT